MSPTALPERDDLVTSLIRRWRTFLIFIVIGGGAGAAYAFLTAEWYSATLTVVPSQKSQDSAAISLASKLPIGLDSLSTDVQRIQAVLTSISVADEIIEKFHLDDHYGTGHREKTRTVLWDHCTTSVDRKSSVVSLSCEDTDPAQAQAMATAFGEIGNQVFRRVSASSAHEERVFLEAQVEKARRDVNEASQALRAFQEQHHIIDLPEQSKAVISAMATLEGEVISKQLELSYLTRFSSRTEANVVQLQQQIGIMQSQLNELEHDAYAKTNPLSSGSGSSSGSDSTAPKDASFFPGAMRVPALRFELEQLMREQKIKETIFMLMTQRYEMARVDEARETSTFQILDHPTLPTFKSRPQRRKIVMLGMLAATVAGLCWIRIPMWWRRRQRERSVA